MLARFCLALLLVTAAAASQSASGIAHGFDDAPCRGVVVRACCGDRVVRECLTDECGRFGVAADQPLTAVVLELEGVQVRLATPGGNAHDLEAHFARQKFDVVRGAVLDPAGDPARGVDVVCNGKGGTIAILTTDAAGAFVLRTQTPVDTFVIDPLGWKCRVAAPFPRAKDDAVQLRCEKDFVRVQGHCFDHSDRPASGWVVRARQRGVLVASTRIAADGSFTLWFRDAVDEVVASDGIEHIGMVGPWSKNARLLLRGREHSPVLLKGRVVGADGAAIVGAAIVPSMDTTKPPRAMMPIAVTDSEGHFAARVFRGQPFVFVAHQESRRTGSAEVPADGDAIVVTIR